MRHQQTEALGIAGGAGDLGGLVAFRHGAHAGRLTTRFGHDLGGIGARFGNQTLLVLLRAVDVIEGRLDLLRRARIGQVELGHLQARAVSLQRFLQALAGRHGQLLTRTQHGVQIGTPHLFTHSAERRLLEHFIAIACAEQIQLGIGHFVLHVDRHIHDVFIAGQYRHAGLVILDLRGVDLGDGFNWPRQFEVGAGLHHPIELAKPEHHAALLFGDQDKAVERKP